MKKQTLEFLAFGNTGASMTKAVLQLCVTKINYSDMTGIILRAFDCQDIEGQSELFIIISPSDGKLHVHICDTDYGRLASYAASNSKGLEKEVSVFYKDRNIMFVSEMIEYAF